MSEENTSEISDQSSVTEADLMELAAKFCATKNIVPVEELTPAMNEMMHGVIRLQGEMIREAIGSLDYILCRIQNDARTRNLLGVGTESFAKLTSAFSKLTGDPVDKVRDLTIPNSAAFYRN